MKNTLKKIKALRRLLLASLLPLVFTSVAFAFTSFEDCLESKGVPKKTKAQQKAYASCHQSNPKDSTGFKGCLAQNGLPAPTAQIRAAELACRKDMYGK